MTEQVMRDRALRNALVVQHHTSWDTARELGDHLTHMVDAYARRLTINAHPTTCDGCHAATIQAELLGWTQP